MNKYTFQQAKTEMRADCYQEVKTTYDRYIEDGFTSATALELTKIACGLQQAREIQEGLFVIGEEIENLSGSLGRLADATENANDIAQRS